MMDRRDFLQSMVAAAASVEALAAKRRASGEAATSHSPKAAGKTDVRVSVDGYTPVASFRRGSALWKVYEDLRTRDGSMVFISSAGETRKLDKSAEAAMAEGNLYLGLDLQEVALSPTDLLAERLLGNGDPEPETVRSVAPPMASAEKNPRTWTTFVGTTEASDVTPVYRGGSTRTYHPIQYFPELAGRSRRDSSTTDLCKVIPDSAHAHWEVIVFGDVGANKTRYIVHTWHRTARIGDGKIAQVIYGHSYPAYPPARQDPPPEDFYQALLAFSEYWDRQLQDFVPAVLPENAWVDLSKHSFAKELMTRPGGVYPKYGAVDRDYAGSEYDGFQDVFTSAIYTNMEWGRLAMARLIIDNYFTEYVDARGMVDMRGPETAQFGMTLSLLARYFSYTGDRSLMRRHRAKIEATARMLADIHDESLGLPKEDPAYGLIRGWSESDSCLMERPSLYWQAYYANSAFAARGFRDIAKAWIEISEDASGAGALARGWLKRSQLLKRQTIESVQKNLQNDRTPPYIGLFPGTTLTFRESLEKEKPSPQQWPHRPYAELLQADVLPARLAHLVIDCMRSYGATTLGVVANVGRLRKDEREILGFISYGYAQMLLRLDRIEEFLLFLYAHRYHAHTRGSWTAGEVTGITGDSALYCVPAQQTIPLLVRWMLVLEDSDEDRLYPAKGLPRAWVISGQETGIEEAPTRWGRVSFNLRAKPATNIIMGHVELHGARAPNEVHFKFRFKFRLPEATRLKSITVNGRSASLGGTHKDTVIIATGQEKTFEVIGLLA
jgi:hypothetical protein